MSWTKRQLISQAFEEAGYASYDFDLQPEQVMSALRKLDSMMATWKTKGIDLGYRLHSNPADSDPDEDSLLPEAAIEGVYLNLSIRIAPSIGKMVAPETKANARYAYVMLLAITAVTPEQVMPAGLPAGAGSKYWQNGADNPFLT